VQPECPADALLTTILLTETRRPFVLSAAVPAHGAVAAATSSSFRGLAASDADITRARTMSSFTIVSAIVTYN
jgi:hypothetical protein